MAQQINLCNPIFLTPKRYFSAATMLQALTVFAVLGGIIAAYWVWSLDESTRGLKKAINANQAEVGGCKRPSPSTRRKAALRSRHWCKT